MADLDDDEGVPWASPEIQLEYEAAVGRFILAFNRVDHKLTGVIGMVLDRVRREQFFTKIKNADFWLKVAVLDLLKLCREGAAISDIPVETLDELRDMRNKLAHGHFDQNPFDGTYDIIGRKNYGFISVTEVSKMIEKAEAAYDKLRYSEACFEFAEPPSA